MLPTQDTLPPPIMQPDSTKINGHRLVTMTESQYAVAVLEDNTLYAVYPDEV